ncbi:antibiotic biosynthesis monooxygenase [Pseudomonas sp. NPDC090201]|uniref:antibiotic biosynthesis monooxygenase n=1 Tax=Pseudomonas sp. NPDC090201 TaxID=3364475 RepID=UPI00382B0330
MLTQAINTIHIRSLPEKSDELGRALVIAGEKVKRLPGCMLHHVVRSHFNPHLWIITGHWKTVVEMRASFHDPAGEYFLELIKLESVFSIEFNSYIVESFGRAVR